VFCTVFSSVSFKADYQLLNVTKTVCSGFLLMSQPLLCLDILFSKKKSWLHHQVTHACCAYIHISNCTFTYELYFICELQTLEEHTSILYILRYPTPYNLVFSCMLHWYKFLGHFPWFVTNNYAIDFVIHILLLLLSSLLNNLHTL
jgi:hypothetical protein